MNDSNANESARDPLLEKSRHLFQDQCVHLDMATGNRLRLMRRDTLNALPARHRRARWQAGAAALTLTIGMAWWMPSRNSDPDSETYAAQTPEAALLEEEDAELYAWLGEAPVAIDASADETSSL
jgi:hypothetical protein